MKQFYKKYSNITINFIANHILIIMFLWIAILSIAILKSKHDLKFLMAPSISFFVPFLIMKFNKHKEEKQNVDFLNILDESIFETAMEIKLELLEISSPEYRKSKPKEIEDNKHYRMVNFQAKEIMIKSLEAIRNIYKVTYDEVKTIQESKLQFYDFETFKKFNKYKLLFCGYEEKMKNLDFDNAYNFYLILHDMSSIDQQKLLDEVILEE